MTACNSSWDVHSLVGALSLSAVLGTAFGTRWGERAGVVLGFVSFSHWLLDLIVHRQDMPVLPGNAAPLPKLGFGLWQLPWAAVSAEFALVSAGAWFYWRAARSVSLAAGMPQRRAGVVSLMIWAGGLLMLALDVTGIPG